jgi:outer membrane protein OmpA-like peptidoglycan-associated protein
MTSMAAAPAGNETRSDEPLRAGAVPPQPRFDGQTASSGQLRLPQFDNSAAASTPQYQAPATALVLPPAYGDPAYGQPAFQVGGGSSLRFGQPQASQFGAIQPGYGGYGGQAAIITFGHGSARLGSADTRMIQQVAQQARQTGLYVRVVGHSSSRTQELDPVTHSLVNFEISAARANAVVDALIQAGVPAQQIFIEAVGDTQPVAPESMPSLEAQNRRAEIFLGS